MHAFTPSNKTCSVTKKKKKKKNHRLFYCFLSQSPAGWQELGSHGGKGVWSLWSLELISICRLGFKIDWYWQGLVLLKAGGYEKRLAYLNNFLATWWGNDLLVLFYIISFHVLDVRTNNSDRCTPGLPQIANSSSHWDHMISWSLIIIIMIIYKLKDVDVRFLRYYERIENRDFTKEESGGWVQSSTLESHNMRKDGWLKKTSCKWWSIIDI